MNDSLQKLNLEIYNCSHNCANKIGQPCPIYLTENFNGLAIIGQNPGVSFKENDPIQITYARRLDYIEHIKLYQRSMERSVLAEFLKKYLSLDIKKTAVLNVCKCAFVGNVEPDKQAIDFCSAYLQKQLSILDKIELTITFGKISARFYGQSLSKVPRFVVENNKVVLPLFHHSYLLKNRMYYYIDKVKELLQARAEIC